MKPDPKSSVEARPDPAAPAFAEDGTDLTVIRWMLSKSPEQRLAWLQSHVEAVLAIRRDDAGA